MYTLVGGLIPRSLSNVLHYLWKQNNIPFSVYDYGKAYEIMPNERFRMHMPLDISIFLIQKKKNNNKNTYFINGCLNNSSPTKTFTTNGFQKIVTPNGSVIKSISHLYKHLGFSYPSIQIKIHQVSTFHHTYSNSSTIQKQNLIVHLSLNFGHFKIEFIFKYWRQRRSKYVIGVRVLIYNVIG